MIPDPKILVAAMVIDAGLFAGQAVEYWYKRRKQLKFCNWHTALQAILMEEI